MQAERLATPAKVVGAGIAGLSIGILMSLVTGFVLGILFAPQSGRETRHQIAEKYYDMKDKTMSFVDRAKGMFHHREHMETRAS